MGFDVDYYFSKELLNSFYTNKISKKKTKGIDRVSQDLFDKKKEEEINIIYNKVLDGSYNFSPFLEELRIKSRNSNPRLLSIPTIRDRLALEALKKALQEYFPKNVRKRVASIFIHEVEKSIKENIYTHYLKVDITSFFSSIDHEMLFNFIEPKLPKLLFTVLKNSILNPTVPRDCLNKEIYKYVPKQGVPQGVSISNILAEVYLNQLDDTMRMDTTIKYYRYVDDILILCNGSYSIKTIEDELTLINLYPNVEKQENGTIKDGFNYLGFYLNDTSISIQEKRIQKFLQRLASKITWFKKAIITPSIRPNWLSNNDLFVSVFLDEINEKITGAISGSKGYGWIFHYKETNNMNQLFRIDEVISLFFQRIEYFDYSVPREIKSIVRAYYEVKFKGLKSNYIGNYNNIDTVHKKRLWLIRRGFIKENDNYSDEYINEVFEVQRDRIIKGLEKDEKDLVDNY